MRYVDKNMKYKMLLTVTLCAVFITCLVVYPTGSSAGVIRGLKMCSSVIIPSLFPFTAVAIFIFKLGIVDRVSHFVSRPAELIFKMNGQELCVFIMSCIGGYPVGAQLIANLYRENKISRSRAEKLLSCCINSGPSYIILAVGTGILSSKDLGYLLFASSLTASVLIAIFVGFLYKNDGVVNNKLSKIKDLNISDIFVDATYEATSSMIKICSFIVLFSAIQGLIDEIITNKHIKSAIIFFSEITNSIISGNKNIFAISFLLGFAGLCVHLQIIAICKDLKIKYLRFLIFRILHGTLSAVITYLLVKLFRITIPAISQGISMQPTSYSVLFSVALLFCAVVFMGSVHNNLKTG